MDYDYRAMIRDGKCVLCTKPLGGIFWRIRIDRGIINVAAAKRQFHLAGFLGSDALAAVMSPERGPLVAFTADVTVEGQSGGTTACLCDGCAIERCAGLMELLEVVNQRDLAEQDQ